MSANPVKDRGVISAAKERSYLRQAVSRRAVRERHLASAPHEVLTGAGQRGYPARTNQILLAQAVIGADLGEYGAHGQAGADGSGRRGALGVAHDRPRELAASWSRWEAEAARVVVVLNLPLARLRRTFTRWHSKQQWSPCSSLSPLIAAADRSS